MKKVLPYILILIVLLVGGGIYLQTHKTGKGLLDVSLLKSSDDSANNDSSSNNDTTTNTDPEFKNYGPAPELAGISHWINSDPQTIASLKGKVVLIDFWTYSCINCVRTLPYVTKWYDTYKDKGLVVIGVHTPEFAFEKVTGNVENAVKADKINYPVAQDNDYKTWTAYKNQFWPAHYLIDKDGNIVYTHFGEGSYDETEKAIRTLLGIDGDYQAPQPAESNQANSPEMYFGLARQKQFASTEKASTSEQIYTYPKKLGDNQFALEGNWQFNQETAIHNNGFGRIKLNFNAAKVFMVAQSAEPTTIRVYVDGTLIKGVVVSNSDLYQLYDSIAGGKHTMEIEVPDSGFQAFTFTFG